jgi:hypothetical protein
VDPRPPAEQPCDLRLNRRVGGWDDKAKGGPAKQGAEVCHNVTMSSIAVLRRWARAASGSPAMARMR